MGSVVIFTIFYKIELDLFIFALQICRFFCRYNANFISILKVLYFSILQAPRPVHTVTMIHIGGNCWLVFGYSWSSLVIFGNYWQFVGDFWWIQVLLGPGTIWHQDNLALDNLAPRKFVTSTIWHRSLWHHNVKIDDCIWITEISVSVWFDKDKCYV